MGLATFSIFNLFYALAVSDESESVFSRSLLANGKLIQMSGFSAIAIVLASELDLLNRFLSTAHMSVDQWLICIAVGSAIVWVTEVEKFFRRRSASSAARVEARPVRTVLQRQP
jgi:P-type Ca2+ transporter type 2C